MFKKAVFILSIGYALTYAQTKAATTSMETGEEVQHKRYATQEDIKVFVECLDKFGVRNMYLQYGDDLSKISREQTVFLWRIDDAIIAYDNAMRTKYGTATKAE